MAKISSPGVNQTVHGLVEIRGTANASSFQFYKVEFRFGDNTGEFHVIDDLKYSPVEDDVLVVWNTGEVSGPVTLRLTVVNIDGNYPTPCEVPVIVQAD
jgi:hypothetical protein